MKIIALIPAYEPEESMLVLLESIKKDTDMDIATIYIYNNRGSHFNVLKDSYRVYKEIFKFCAASIKLNYKKDCP